MIQGVGSTSPALSLEARFRDITKLKTDLEVFRSELQSIDRKILEMKTNGNFITMINLKNQFTKILDIQGEKIASLLYSEYRRKQQTTRDKFSVREKRVRGKFSKIIRDNQLEFNAKKKELKKKYSDFIKKKKIVIVDELRCQTAKKTTHTKALRKVYDFLEQHENGARNCVIHKRIRNREKAEIIHHQRMIERTTKLRIKRYVENYERVKSKKIQYLEKITKNLKNEEKAEFDNLSKLKNGEQRNHEFELNKKIDDIEKSLGFPHQQHGIAGLVQAMKKKDAKRDAVSLKRRKREMLLAKKKRMKNAFSQHVQRFKYPAEVFY